MKNKKKSKKEENVFGFEVDVAKGTCPDQKDQNVDKVTQVK
jgi:hypothetical protein